jgi:hypothetical protein
MMMKNQNTILERETKAPGKIAGRRAGSRRRSCPRITTSLSTTRSKKDLQRLRAKRAGPNIGVGPTMYRKPRQQICLRIAGRPSKVLLPQEAPPSNHPSCPTPPLHLATHRFTKRYTFTNICTAVLFFFASPGSLFGTLFFHFFRSVWAPAGKKLGRVFWSHRHFKHR